MKCIILASGRGSRLNPLTNTVPKPMLKVAGKPIIEHNMEHVYKHVDEIIIIVRHLKEQFIEYFGLDYKGTPVRYFEQGPKNGTAAALFGLFITDDAMVLYGDSIFEKRDISLLAKHKKYGCLVQRVEHPERYGIFIAQVDGTAMKVIEKPEEDYGNLANVGAYKFSPDIFKYLKNVEQSERGEYELTDAINTYCEKHRFDLIDMKGSFVDVGYPWQILDANSVFLSKLKKSTIDGELEKGVYIKGNIVLGKGSVIKSGTRIEGNAIIGRNCIIGPNVCIRGDSVIGDNARIGNAVEIKNSSIGNATCVAHLSYIGDSVIGNNVNIGGGTITANVRHDKKNMRCMIGETLVDTGRKKLGLISGDHVRIGINNSIYPGRVIDTAGTTLPGEIVK